MLNVMKTITRIFFALTLMMAFLFSGCKKDQDRIMIEGSIMDAVQSAPVADATISLYGKVLEGGIYNPSSTVIASAVSDAQGKFAINIQQVKASDFELVVTRTSYFEYREALTVDDISSGNTYEPVIQFSPEGWLRLKVQNSNPINASDLISYRIISDNPECSDCCNSAWKQGQGMVVNTESLCRSKAGSQALIVWNIHKGINHASDSTLVPIPLFDTAFYHLQY